MTFRAVCHYADGTTGLEVFPADEVIGFDRKSVSQPGCSILLDKREVCAHNDTVYIHRFRFNGYYQYCPP